MLLESIRQSHSALTEQDLFKWHHMLFIEKPLLYTMAIGDYRNETMQVVSGRFGKQTVHFEAPCQDREGVAEEMQQSLNFGL